MSVVRCKVERGKRVEVIEVIVSVSYHRRRLKGLEVLVTCRKA